jgi:hypothetical protein
MNHKTAGAILLATAGLIVAIGAVGAQIANAIAEGLFYAGNKSGVVPPGPESASPHWMIIVAALILAATGFLLLLSRKSSSA